MKIESTYNLLQVEYCANLGRKLFCSVSAISVHEFAGTSHTYGYRFYTIIQCRDRKVLNPNRRGFGVEVGRATTKDTKRIFEKECGRDRRRRPLQTTRNFLVTAPVRVKNGSEFWFFAAFFRRLKRWHPQTRTAEYAYSLTWAVRDVVCKRSINVSRADGNAAQEGIRTMDRGLGSKDKRLNRALREILERGNLPISDRIFESRVYVNEDKLELDYGGAKFYKWARWCDNRSRRCCRDG